MDFTIVFLVMNALFWGLASHSTHCEISNTFGIKCGPHYIHLLMGLVFFILSIYIKHKSYIDFLRKA